MMMLRDYQLKAYESALLAWLKVQSVMLVLPTGLGKTEIFVAIADGWNLGRILICAPTIQLVSQAAKKIAQRTGVAPAIEQANLYSNETEWARSPFVVGCIPSLCSSNKSTGGEPRYKRLRDIGLVIIDECHLGATPRIKTMVDHFRSEGAKVLGVTATPLRHDGKAMKNLFDACPFTMSIQDAIQEGWLVSAKTHCVQLEQLDLSQVATTRKDFKEAELAKVMEQEKVVYEIADVTARESGKLKTAVFCASVQEARSVAELLVDRYELKADWICGDKQLCSDQKRKEVLDSFTGADPDGVQVVCNVGILTTGWDFPGLEHIVMARPTKSLSLYTQIFGRGTRALPGVVDFARSTPETRRAAIAASAKPHFKVTDLVDNSLKHKLVSCADVLGGEMGLEVIERAKKNLTEAKEAIEIDQALRDAKGQVEAEQAERERKRRAAIAARSQYKSVEVDPFSDSQRGTLRQRELTGKKMRFGKYKGQDMAEVPSNYLEWAVNQDSLAWFRGSAYQELARRRKAGLFARDTR